MDRGCASYVAPSCVVLVLLTGQRILNNSVEIPIIVTEEEDW